LPSSNPMVVLLFRVLSYLAPLAGRGRIALAIRVRGYRSHHVHGSR